MPDDCKIEYKTVYECGDRIRTYLQLLCGTYHYILKITNMATVERLGVILFKRKRRRNMRQRKLYAQINK